MDTLPSFEPNFNKKMDKPKPKRPYVAPRLLRTCKYCETDGLIWQQYHGKWRLFRPGDDEPHFCHVPM